MAKKILYFILFLLCLQIATAATIHGTVYSYDLEKKSDVIITIDSTPPQTVVSKNGTYNFELSPGIYTINATYSVYGEIKEAASETIKIEKQGSFNLDIILFPNFEEEEEILRETDEEVIDEEKDYTTWIVLIGAAILFIGLFIIFMKYRKQLEEVTQEVKKTAEKLDNENGLVKEVLEFIKNQDGRTTQKEIRKHFPSSEAKISLIISELEEKGKIRKIKKGRGNIIVLQ